MTTTKQVTLRRRLNTCFIGVNVDKQTLQRLDRLASEENASRSFVIRKLITEILALYENAKVAKS